MVTFVVVGNETGAFIVNIKLIKTEKENNWYLSLNFEC